MLIRRRSGRGRLLVWLLIGLLVAAPLLSGTFGSGRADADLDSLALSSSPCGWSDSAAPQYRHVVWIWMENRSYRQIIHSAQAPFENTLAKACGLATNYHAIAHPSLPNYLAATGGSTFAVRSDASPRQRPVKAPSLFGEVRRSRRPWRTFVESMPGNCRPVGAHGYARNPAAYFRDSRRMCSRWDVPMGTSAFGPLARDLRMARLPAFSLIIPNLCHATHGCPVATGDAWLSRLVTHIVRSPAYGAGHTAIFVTWDEGKRDIGQHIPLIVVSPSTPRGTVVSTRYYHYSLLRTTTDLLHLRAPGKAASHASMQVAFGL